MIKSRNYNNNKKKKNTFKLRDVVSSCQPASKRVFQGGMNDSLKQIVQVALKRLAQHADCSSSFRKNQSSRPNQEMQKLRLILMVSIFDKLGIAAFFPGLRFFHDCFEWDRQLKHPGLFEDGIPNNNVWTKAGTGYIDRKIVY